MRAASETAISTLKAKQKEKIEKVSKIIMDISGMNESLEEEKEKLASEIEELKTELAARDS